jgi:4-hydroxy-4-methyl-2-oxoglutarate aldolase
MTITIYERGSDPVLPREIDRWRSVPAAIAADVSKGACLIDPAIRPLRPPGQQPKLFGRAVTVACEPPDFGGVLHAIDHVGAGDVLLISASGHARHAMIGGILGAQLRRQGCAGIVCDGAVRDVAELSAWNDLSVFSRSITPGGPAAAERGSVNGVVDIVGLKVSPGDLLIGDDDGLVALSPSLIVGLIDAAEEKLALEAKWQAHLAAGQTVAVTFGLPASVRVKS